MRVLIATSGTTGDVVPYVGLADRLRAAGHVVTIGTHEPYRSLVEGAGLAFTPVAGDLMALLRQARGQDGRSRGSGWRAVAQAVRAGRPLARDLARGITEAAAATGPDVLLLSGFTYPYGIHVAEARGIPWAGAFLQPIHPSRAYGPLLLGGASFGPAGNLLLGRLSLGAVRRAFGGVILRLRRDLGLPRVSSGTAERSHRLRYPTFHGFSPVVVPRPADWPAPLRAGGYWWPLADADWQPPAPLADFLAAGPPPVLIGFGSMAPGQGPRLAGIAVAAARAAGVRAIVQAGWSGMDVRDAGPGVLSIGEAPHAWLLPRASAVVHHAGAGTTAAALRAGCPAVPVPVLADQPFWARRVHELGAATAPIPMSTLTAGRLAAALRTATTDPALAEAAQHLSARITAEDGAADLLSWLDAGCPRAAAWQ